MRDYTLEKTEFLIKLGKGYTVTAAAEASGVARRTLYDLRDREPSFRDAWDHAIKEGTETIEQEVYERAFDREDNKSHLLLMFLLKGRDPRFKESHKTERKVIHETVHEISFSEEERDRAIEILTNAIPEKNSEPLLELPAAQPQTPSE